MQFAKTSLRSFVRYLVVAVAMVSVMPCLSLFTATALALPGVTIPDDNLRAALEQELGKGEGDPLTRADPARLIFLDLTSYPYISNLTGLELCTNLERLEAHNNKISDISALAGLNKLWRLGLSRNNISDISPIASLTNLTSLKGLDLTRNALNSAAYAIHIPALEARGVSVLYDPEPPVTIPDENLRAELWAALEKVQGTALRKVS